MADFIQEGEALHVGDEIELRAYFEPGWIDLDFLTPTPAELETDLWEELKRAPIQVQKRPEPLFARAKRSYGGFDFPPGWETMAHPETVPFAAVILEVVPQSDLTKSELFNARGFQEAGAGFQAIIVGVLVVAGLAFGASMLTEWRRLESGFTAEEKGEAVSTTARVATAVGMLALAATFAIVVYAARKAKVGA